MYYKVKIKTMKYIVLTYCVLTRNIAGAMKMYEKLFNKYLSKVDTPEAFDIWKDIQETNLGKTFNNRLGNQNASENFVEKLKKL